MLNSINFNTEVARFSELCQAENPVQFIEMKQIIILLSLLFLISCTHKPGIIPLITPPLTANSCDSANAKYTTDIKPIIKQHCYSCHSSGATTEDGLDLEDTTKLKDYLKNGFRGDGIYGSKFYHCLLHSPYAQQMPPTYILDSCSLHKIHYWLGQGAPL